MEPPSNDLFRTVTNLCFIERFFCGVLMFSMCHRHKISQCELTSWLFSMHILFCALLRDFCILTSSIQSVATRFKSEYWTCVMFMCRGMRDLISVCVGLLYYFWLSKTAGDNDTSPRRLTEDVSLFFLLSLPSQRGPLNIIQKCASKLLAAWDNSSERWWWV